MAGKQLEALGLWQVAADAGGQHGFLDQAGDVFVRQPISGGFTVIAADALEQRAEVDPGIMQILLKRMHRAALIAGASANLNLAPAGFAVKRQDQTLFFQPAMAIQPLPSSVSSPIDIEADDFRAAQAARITDQQDGPVSLVSQAKG